MDMKKRITVIYLVGIHALLVVVLLKSDFIERVENRLGLKHSALSPEMTPLFLQMLDYHKRMDGNVPGGAVVFIGDSITQGPVRFSGRVSFGETMGSVATRPRGVLHRLPEYRSIGRASAVVLAIGVNDMKYRSNTRILENERSIIDRIPKGTPVLLSAVLPVDEEFGDEWPGRSQDRIRDLNSRLKHLADQEDRVTFVDAGPLLVDGNGNLADEYHDGDGLHLNSEGNAVWSEVLRAGLREARERATLEGD